MSKKRASTSNRKRVSVYMDEQTHGKGTKLAKVRRLSFSRYLEVLIEGSAKAA